MTGTSEPKAADVAAVPVRQSAGVMIGADGSVQDLQAAQLGQVTQPDQDDG